MSGTRHLTQRGLADRYAKSERTIEDWRRDGRGPPWIRLNGRDIVYAVDAVERWEAERTYSTRAEELAATATTKPAT